MKIRKELLELIILQDRITHLNEAGFGHTAYIENLKNERNAVMDEIVLEFDRLKDIMGHTVEERWEL